MRGVTNAVLSLIALAVGATAQANIIDLGEIDLTGTFTLNHSFDFNNPAASPFGTFSILTAQSATGIFGPYIAAGDPLSMNVPFMYGVISPSQQMIWNIGGYTFNTTLVLITGADFVGRNCLGITDLSGNGFDPSAYGLGAHSFWNFTAPPYDISNFPKDITGPIDLKITVAYDNGRVPEDGSTLVFLFLGSVAVAALRWKLAACWL